VSRTSPELFFRTFALSGLFVGVQNYAIRAFRFVCGCPELRHPQGKGRTPTIEMTVSAMSSEQRALYDALDLGRSLAS
jgi:hypothetical protein